MIRTILVPTSGSATDETVFATALAIARPLSAHLQFLHVRFSPLEAALRDSRVQFRAGAALTDALGQLQKRNDQLAADAAGHFRDFCSGNRITTRSSPIPIRELSAAWLEKTDAGERELFQHARHCDLVVLGRSRHSSLMPPDLIQQMLLRSGRPVVLAPDTRRAKKTGTYAVGWNETPECARALACAMPLLEIAERVVLLTVAEGSTATLEQLEHLAVQLAWHGINAETRLIRADSQPVADTLIEAVTRLDPDLFVAGGFGHARLREYIFGGVTQQLIQNAQFPALLLH